MIVLNAIQIKKFWSRVNKRGPIPATKYGCKSRCWNWLGNVSPLGYGRANFNNKLYLATHISFELATEQHIDPKTNIYHRCKNNLCVNPKHLTLEPNTYTCNYNINFFKRRNKDYWYFLGVALSDGCITKRNKYDSFAWGSVDIAWVKQWVKLLGTHSFLYTSRNSNWNKQLIMIICHKQIIDILHKDGCFERKSLSLRMPRVPRTYFAHFLRGIVDGDGHVKLVKDNHGGLIQITSGSKTFIQSLQKELFRLFKIKASIIVSVNKKSSKRRKASTAYRLTLHGIRSGKMAKILVDINSLCLKRKTNELLKIVNYYFPEGG